MKNCIFILFGILFFGSYSASAQERTDSIMTKYFLGSPYFKQYGKFMTTPRFNKVMKTQPEAYAEWKKGKPSLIIATILGAIGGGTIGASIGQNIDNESKLICVGVGFAFIGVSIPFQRKFNQHIKKAVKIYNSNL